MLMGKFLFLFLFLLNEAKNVEAPVQPQQTQNTQSNQVASSQSAQVEAKLPKLAQVIRKQTKFQ